MLTVSGAAANISDLETFSRLQEENLDGNITKSSVTARDISPNGRQSPDRKTNVSTNV